MNDPLPLLGEADPELERLLAEEEEIVRRARYARDADCQCPVTETTYDGRIHTWVLPAVTVCAVCDMTLEHHRRWQHPHPLWDPDPGRKRCAGFAAALDESFEA